MAPATNAVCENNCFLPFPDITTMADTQYEFPIDTSFDRVFNEQGLGDLSFD
jgi:hypothetical protein